MKKLVLSDEEKQYILDKRAEMQEKEEINEIKKEKKLIEFSKKIMFFVMLSAFIVIFYSMYVIHKTNDLTSLGILISETMQFAKVGVGFYSVKAMAENISKYRTNNEST